MMFSRTKRVERFAARQQHQVVRQKKMRGYRRSFLFLFVNILLIRLYYFKQNTPSKPQAAVAVVADINNNINNVVDSKEAQLQKQKAEQEEEEILRKAELQEGEESISSSNDNEEKYDNQEDNEPSQRKRKKKQGGVLGKKIVPRTVSIPPGELRLMLETQTRLENSAREQQGAFCRDWNARLKVRDETELAKLQLPPLIPSALEEITSLFHDDQTYMMEVYAEKDDIVSGFVLDSGSWEREKIQRMAEWLQEYANTEQIPLENVTFVDVGANVGVYTFALADLGVRVIAIEPMPQNVQLLRRSLCRNPELAHRIILHPVAVSSSSSSPSCRMYSHIKNIGDGHLHCDTDHVNNTYENDPNFVRRDDMDNNNNNNGVFSSNTAKGGLMVVRLDDVIGHTPFIGAVKMDVEGYESHVVAGGTYTFGTARIPYIQMEYNPQWMRKKGGNPQALLDMFFMSSSLSEEEEEKKKKNPATAGYTNSNYYRVRRDARTNKGKWEPFLTEMQARNESHLTGLNDVLFELVVV